MTEIQARRSADRCPSHPGAVILDLIETNGLTKTGAADMLDVSRQHLHALLAEERPVTREMAAKLGKLFGNGPGLWLRMQAAYDTWHAEREVDTSKVHTLVAA